MPSPAQLNHKFATFLLRRRLLCEFECNPVIRSVSPLLVKLNELLSRVILHVWKTLEAIPSKWNSKICCAAMVIDSLTGLVNDAIAGAATLTLQKLVSHCCFCRPTRRTPSRIDSVIFHTQVRYTLNICDAFVSKRLV